MFIRFKIKNKWFKVHFLIPLSILLVLLVVFSTGSFALFQTTVVGQKNNVVDIGTLEITYDDNYGADNRINLENALPMGNTDGMNTKPYKFKVTNTGTFDTNYRIRLISNEGIPTNEALALNNIMISVDDKAPYLLSSIASKENVIISDALVVGQMKEHNIRMWIKEDATNDVLNKRYSGKLIIEDKEGELTLPDTPKECFVFDAGTFTITGYNNLPQCSDRVKFPAKIDGVDVLYIDSNFSTNNGNTIIFKEVEFSEGLQQIRLNAFLNPQFESVTLPNSLQFLGESVFAGSTAGSCKIKSVQFGTDMEAINGGTFKNCQIEGLDLSNIREVNGEAFYGNRINKITFGNDIGYIGDKAFMGNAIQKINISTRNYLVVGTSAFESNDLRTIRLDSIGIDFRPYAFSKTATSNQNLNNIYLPMMPINTEWSQWISATRSNGFAIDPCPGGGVCIEESGQLLNSYGDIRIQTGI